MQKPPQKRSKRSIKTPSKRTTKPLSKSPSKFRQCWNFGQDPKTKEAEAGPIFLVLWILTIVISAVVGGIITRSAFPQTITTEVEVVKRPDHDPLEANLTICIRDFYIDFYTLDTFVERNFTYEVFEATLLMTAINNSNWEFIYNSPATNESNLIEHLNNTNTNFVYGSDSIDIDFQDFYWRFRLGEGEEVNASNTISIENTCFNYSFYQKVVHYYSLSLVIYARLADNSINFFGIPSFNFAIPIPDLVHFIKGVDRNLLIFPNQTTTLEIIGARYNSTVAAFIGFDVLINGALWFVNV